MNATCARLSVLCVLLATASAALTAQVDWQVEDPRTRAVVRGERSVVVEPKALVRTPAGQVRADFPFDADGKPMSLALEVGDGERVVLGVDAAAPVDARAVDPFADGGADVTLAAKVRPEPLQARVVGGGDDDAANYRVTVTVAPREVGAFGVVARYRADAGGYLFSIDWQARTLRLERWMGGDHVVIAEQQWSGEWSDVHTLALQCDGFRLQAFVDDGLVLQALDGALRRGALGVAWSSERAACRDVTVAAPAAPRGSIALVQREGSATVHARTMVPPGNFYCLQLRIDRPHPDLPRDLAGNEPAIGQPPRGPVVLWADPRGSWAPNGLGEVPASGELTLELTWEQQPWLQKEVALARVLFVSARGDFLHGATAPVRVIF